MRESSMGAAIFIGIYELDCKGDASHSPRSTWPAEGRKRRGKREGDVKSPNPDQHHTLLLREERVTGVRWELFCGDASWECLTPRWECSYVWCPLGVFLWGYQLGVRSEVPVGSADWEAVPVGSAGQTWPAQSSLFCNVRRLVRFDCHWVGQLCSIGRRRYAVPSVRS